MSTPRVLIPIPATAKAVLERWNPQGLALLETARAGDGAVRDAVLVGVDDANTALLRAGLAKFTPRIGLSEPVVEPERPVGVALVLLDAGGPAGAHTLEVAHRLWAEGARVVFGLNGIHAHSEWRAVLDRDLDLLRAVRPNGVDVDIVPVSPQLALAAGAGDDAALLDRSGLALLHARLAAATGAVTAADQAAAVLKRVIADTRHRVDEQIDLLRSGSDVAALREERVMLLAASDGGRSVAMATLHSRLQLARVDLVHEVGARIRQLNIAARADVERLGRAEQRDYPQSLQCAVHELTAVIDTEFLHRFAELTQLIEIAMEPFDRVIRSAAAASAAESLDSEHVQEPTGPDEPDPPVKSRRTQRPTTPRVGPGPEPRHPGVEDRLMIAVGASAGFGLGRLIVSPFALVPALDYATVPVTLLLGAAVAAWLARARGQLADRAHLRQWIADALVNVKAQLEQRVAAVLVDAEEQLTDHVVRSTTARMVVADRRVGEIEARLRTAAARRPAQLAACERDLDTLGFA
ncbi:hypothetical protein HLB23_31985 [Nocardia uniformis]|uniref:Uncharacterized protein n=1 Tax=Nocardia uniformis TaxID=53432 RepID=A0A849C997_9NOCA|nr:hypothetical protein [Nocardia uniformis]NNH74416.1 hypothetical protein [Nocardia uniformis]